MCAAVHRNFYGRACRRARDLHCGVLRKSCGQFRDSARDMKPGTARFDDLERDHASGKTRTIAVRRALVCAHLIFTSRATQMMITAAITTARHNGTKYGTSVDGERDLNP